MGCTQIPALSPEQEALVGTWRWEYSSVWTLVFRPDGTGTDGPPEVITEFEWIIEDSRLFIDGIDQNLRFEENTITLHRFADATPYTYFRYSDIYSDTPERAGGFTPNPLVMMIIFIAVPTSVIGFMAGLARRGAGRK